MKNGIIKTSMELFGLLGKASATSVLSPYLNKYGTIVFSSISIFFIFLLIFLSSVIGIVNIENKNGNENENENEKRKINILLGIPMALIIIIIITNIVLIWYNKSGKLSLKLMSIK